TLHVQPQRLVFTSGGTEANNLAVLGAARAKKRRGNHVITTQIEHPSVYEACRALEGEGFEVTYLPVDGDGLVDPEAVRAALRPETVLVSCMAVNNEVGAVEPVEEIARVIRETDPQILFHVDAIQGYGKYVFRPDRQGIDLLSVSGHKVRAPKGIGALYFAERVRLIPLVYGGEQQKGVRSGTENVPGIAAFGAAAKHAYDVLPEEHARLRALKNRLVAGLSELEGVRVHGRTGEDSAPHITAAGFAGIRSEVLLHALEDKGFYVSSGSACSSRSPRPSRTLTAMGVPEEYLYSTLRFSMGEENEPEDVDGLLEALRVLLPQLRRFVRR
ncbi:MAG: cysteine desulfurase, partial [Lachnospiraceae bacterium]|nr:cysteine desulfurase [Lachnospiraceae bacterium]